jgi:hypothetical protein
VESVARNKLEEIEVALDTEFPHIAVKAEIAPELEFILFIINIGIAQLGVMSGYPESYIISKLLSEKYSDSRFRPVNMIIGVQVSKIMGGANGDAKFSFVNKAVILRNIPVLGGSLKQEAQKTHPAY